MSVTSACRGCSGLHTAAEALAWCPACGAKALDPAEPRYPASPERWIPRKIDAEGARARVAAAVAETWFPTADLGQAAAAERLVAVWWPHWLVDVDAVGIWEAEAGFDEQVHSSQEVLERGRWTTREVLETRVRWEARAGRVRRRYENLVVPALGLPGPADSALAEGPQAASTPDLAASEPCGETVPGAIQLPDRAPAEQWPEALAALRSRVAVDLALAAGADHVRALFLDVDAADAHWTLLLVPGFATWYTDDDGVVRVLRVDGVEGGVTGPRMASPAAGRRAAGLWFAAGAVVGAAGLLLGVVGLLIWFLLPVAATVVFVGALIGLVGFWPLLAPASHNRGELDRRG